MEVFIANFGGLHRALHRHEEDDRRHHASEAGRLALVQPRQDHLLDRERPLDPPREEELWWSTSLPGEPEVSLEEGIGPSHLSRRVYVIHKPAMAWSDRSKKGSRLRWDALHPRARELLLMEGTFHQLSEENAAYAIALLEGSDLEPWHKLPAWKGKADRAGRGAATTLNAKRTAAMRMAIRVRDIVAGSNGQQVLRTVKNKENRFGSLQELEQYIAALIDGQDGLCALTGLRLQYDGECDDRELLCSLDRIESDGHYEPGNLQVVCQFANRWKNDGDDATFRRLLELVRS